MSQLNRLNRYDQNMAVIAQLTLARLAVAELNDKGIAVLPDGVDLNSKTPLIRVRHSAQCDDLVGECLGRSSGPQEHWFAVYKGCTVTWTVRFDRGEVVQLKRAGRRS